MATIGELTGGVAHDFNNMLNVIVSSVELLTETLRDNPAGLRLCDDIMQSALAGIELTGRLLNFAREPALPPAPLDLNQQVTRQLDVLRRTLGSTIVLSDNFADDLWLIQAAPSHIANALLNLTINARGAMPDGGCLVIRTANLSLDAASAASHGDLAVADYVVLSVTDTGIGMPPEVLAKATEPFFTTKPPGSGTGLGLSMIQSFARQSGGALRITSRVGVGTTVRLYLPRAFAPGAPMTAPSEAAPHGTESILLVDDNIALRTSTMRQLTAMGYQVTATGSSTAALDRLRAEPRMDLLLTDVVMPGDMTGFQLAAAARALQPGIAVLFTTGYLPTMKGNSANLILHKPYVRHQLLAHIRTALGQAKGKRKEEVLCRVGDTPSAR
jgi:two-component system CheB/CheR fusion protein